MQEFVLRDLLAESKDGEWGKGEPADDLVEMLVIRGTDFESVRVGDLSSVPRRFIPKRIADRKALRPNDLLIETAGGSKDRPTGRTLFIKPEVIRKSGVPVTCASFARFLRIDFAKADAEYVFWLLQTMYESRQLLKYHTQHTGVARYQFTTFADNEPLLLPDMATQRRIASILSPYDDLIENNTRRIAILEEMARRIYEEWFVRFRFPGYEQVKMVESELGLIPEGWSLCRLAEVCSRITDGSHSSPSSVDAGKPMASVKDMTDWGINTSSCRLISDEDYQKLVRNDCKPRLNDVLIAKDGSYLKHTFVVDEEIDLAILSSIAILRPNGRFLPNQLALYLRLPHIKDRMKGYVSGVAIPRIILKDFRQFMILVPPASLQREWAERCDAMLSLCRKLVRKNANLRATRDLLLPKLISGELDVSTLPEPEEAIAA